MDIFDFIIEFGVSMFALVLGLIVGMEIVVSEIKKKGTLRIKSGVLRYIPNNVLDSDLGGVA